MYEEVNFLVTLLSFSITFFLIKYHWNRRWLYYHASKFDGPLPLPLIGNAHYFIGSPEDFTDKGIKVLSANPEIFRMWLGQDLYFFNSRPEDIDFILCKCLEKAPVYEILTGNEISHSIFASPLDHWRKNRKLINQTFNPKIITSFQSNFANHSRCFVDDLKDKCQDKIEIFPIIWKTNIEMACETLFDIDSNSISNPSEAILQLMRLEEILAQRTFKPWLHPEVFWKLSPLCKEATLLSSNLKKFASDLIQIKKCQRSGDDAVKKLQFLNHLINNETELTEKELLHETYLMLIASTETTAVTESFVLLVLGIFPNIQQKIYEEAYAIFGDSKRDATLEDLNQMHYLERVIKETTRLFPTVLVIGRFVDKDMRLNNHVYPKGSTIVLPIVHIHRSPKLWKNPLSFDPDRFLPEEAQKRHRCAHLPFSYGPRNCPGTQYGMMSMKTTLSTFVRYYKVVSCNYQKLEDIKLVFNVLTKAHQGFKVVLEKRM